MAGAAHLLNDDAAVLFVRCMRKEISVGQKGEILFLMFTFSVRIQTVKAFVMSCCPQHDNLNWSSCSCVEGQHGHRVVVLRTTPHHT